VLSHILLFVIEYRVGPRLDITVRTAAAAAGCQLICIRPMIIIFFTEILQVLQLHCQPLRIIRSFRLNLKPVFFLSPKTKVSFRKQYPLLVFYRLNGFSFGSVIFFDFSYTNFQQLVITLEHNHKCISILRSFFLLI
jgi:hypothetical protein